MATTEPLATTATAAAAVPTGDAHPPDTNPSLDGTGDREREGEGEGERDRGDAAASRQRTDLFLLFVAPATRPTWRPIAIAFLRSSVPSVVRSFHFSPAKNVGRELISHLSGTMSFVGKERMLAEIGHAVIMRGAFSCVGGAVSSIYFITGRNLARRAPERTPGAFPHNHYSVLRFVTIIALGGASTSAHPPSVPPPFLSFIGHRTGRQSPRGSLLLGRGSQSSGSR